MKKTFDCVEMKRKAQEKIYEQIKDLSLDEEIEYFNKAGERFLREMEVLRKEEKKTTKRAKGGRKTTRVPSKG